MPQIKVSEGTCPIQLIEEVGVEPTIIHIAHYLEQAITRKAHVEHQSLNAEQVIALIRARFPQATPDHLNQGLHYYLNHLPEPQDFTPP